MSGRGPSPFPTKGAAFAFECDRRIRAAMVGCGGQAYRNLLPSFAYAPIDLVVTCDVNGDVARSYAAQFGADRWTNSYEEVLASGDLDAVFLAVGYDAAGRPRYPQMAEEAVAAGLHVWMEKPPAATTAEIERLHTAVKAADRRIGVGFMKMFSATTTRVLDLIGRPEFGRPTTVSLRDPELLPPKERRTDQAAMMYFIDHIVHPVSTLHRLLGPVDRIYMDDAPNGGAIIAIGFSSGTVGVLHLPWGQSETSPMERLEIVGEGANVVVEGNLEVTYYRPGHRGATQMSYGRGADFTSDPDVAPVRWQMDGYSGQPYNMHLFYQGYAPELIYFARCVLDGHPVGVGSLEDAWYVTAFFEACQGPSRTTIDLPACPFADC